MNLDYSDKVAELIAQVEVFMKEHIYPRELEYWEWVDNPENLWKYPPWHAELKEKAKLAGIWNWFLNKDYEEKVLRLIQARILMENCRSGERERVEY